MRLVQDIQKKLSDKKDKIKDEKDQHLYIEEILFWI